MGILQASLGRRGAAFVSDVVCSPFLTSLLSPSRAAFETTAMHAARKAFLREVLGHPNAIAKGLNSESNLVSQAALLKLLVLAPDILTEGRNFERVSGHVVVIEPGCALGAFGLGYRASVVRPCVSLEFDVAKTVF